MMFRLEEANLEALQIWLRKHKLIDAQTTVTGAEKPGEGNMNKVLRASLDNGATLIVKQARPWVEKFPEIGAPTERIEVEATYYRQTASDPGIAALSPRIRLHDAADHIIVSEDLGFSSDLTRIYRSGELLDTACIERLSDYLVALHSSFTRQNCDFYIQNRAMRALNAEHIFRFPLQRDNGLSLDEITPGLDDAAQSLRSDGPLKSRIAELEQCYLADGDTLVHGDFYPGSILETDQGLRVIDPEFCYFGDAEFDLGVFIAHLMMADQPREAVTSLTTRYRASLAIDEDRCRKYTAIEMIRRLIGLAQVPLSLTLQQKSALLEQGRDWLLA